MVGMASGSRSCTGGARGRGAGTARAAAPPADHGWAVGGGTTAHARASPGAEPGRRGVRRGECRVVRPGRKGCPYRVVVIGGIRGRRDVFGIHERFRRSGAVGRGVSPAAFGTGHPADPIGLGLGWGKCGRSRNFDSAAGPVPGYSAMPLPARGLLVAALTPNLDHSEELLRAVRIDITVSNGRRRLFSPGDRIQVVDRPTPRAVLSV